MSNTAAPAQIVRVRVFVDFWNFTLDINSRDKNFRVDWSKLGHIISTEAAGIVAPGAFLKFQGMNVYGSYDPSKPKDAKLKNWFLNTLDKMAGVDVILLARQRKRSGPTCPNCQYTIEKCPECGGDMRGTEEKGVDTRIATDMISLAWIDNYDVAVLVSADRDFVPVAEFLQTKGIKVVHGAFPPAGSQLTQKCWAHINMATLMPKFKRAEIAK
jgi:uncharacterized LabA/DUF88 family protein